MNDLNAAIRFIPMALIFCCMAAGVSSQAESPDSGPKVLVVHSYHEAQKGHVVEMNMGIEEALRGAGARILYEYMDTKRNKSVDWMIRAGQQAARTLESFGPDVVIALDDNAQEYFAKEFSRKPGAPVFVFSGVNADPGKYGFPSRNVTGVLERPNVRDSIELLLKILPGVRTLVMLSEKTSTGDFFCDYSKTLDLPVKVLAYEQPLTFDAWKKAIDTWKDHADALGIYVIRSIQRSGTDTQPVPENELMDYLLENSSLPTVGFFDTAAQSGVMCGISVSMQEQGYAAGMIARAILEGGNASDFIPAPTDKGRILLNLKTAEKLGVEIRWSIISKAEEVIR